MDPNQYCRRCAASGSSLLLQLPLPAPSGAPSWPSTPSAARWTTWWTNATIRPSPPPSWSWWRQEVERIADGQPQHPVGQALQAAGRQFNLPREQLLEIIDGMEMDLSSRATSTSGAVALLLPRGQRGWPARRRNLRYRDRQTLKYAHDLGMAFQLTNIVRDIGEDAPPGRIYIPMDELKQFDVPAADI